MRFQPKPISRFQRFWRSCKDYAYAAFLLASLVAVVAALVMFFTIVISIVLTFVALGCLLWITGIVPVTVTINGEERKYRAWKRIK